MALISLIIVKIVNDIETLRKSLEKNKMTILYKSYHYFIRNINYTELFA